MDTNGACCYCWGCKFARSCHVRKTNSELIVPVLPKPCSLPLSQASSLMFRMHQSKKSSAAPEFGGLLFSHLIRSRKKPNRSTSKSLVEIAEAVRSAVVGPGTLGSNECQLNRSFEGPSWNHRVRVQSQRTCRREASKCPLRPGDPTKLGSVELHSILALKHMTPTGGRFPKLESLSGNL